MNKLPQNKEELRSFLEDLKEPKNLEGRVDEIVEIIKSTMKPYLSQPNGKYYQSSLHMVKTAQGWKDPEALSITIKDLCLTLDNPYLFGLEIPGFQL